MSRDQDALLSIPDRPHAGRERFLPGLVTTVVPLSLLAWLVYEGAGPVAWAGLALAIVGNICWSVGCLIPDGVRARMFRTAAVAASVITAMGLTAWAALQVTDFDW